MTIKYTIHKSITDSETNGIFSYMKENFNFQPIMNSSEEVLNLYAMIDLSSKDFAQSSEIQLPLTIDMDFGKYSVLIYDYLMQGKYQYRGMSEWEISGKNYIQDDWKTIDYRKDYNYCDIENGDMCQSEKLTKISCQETTKPFRFIQFKMIADNYAPNDYFRLQNFEIYGTILLTFIPTCKANISKISFILIINFLY